MMCVRPLRCLAIRPASSSTFTCLDAPANVISKGSASSPIDFSPSARLASIPRRVGSDRALKVASSRFSTMWFRIVSPDRLSTVRLNDGRLQPFHAPAYHKATSEIGESPNVKSIRWLLGTATLVAAVTAAAAPPGAFSAKRLSDVDKQLSSDAFQGRGTASAIEPTV